MYRARGERNAAGGYRRASTSTAEMLGFFSSVLAAAYRRETATVLCPARLWRPCSVLVLEGDDVAVVSGEGGQPTVLQLRGVANTTILSAVVAAPNLKRFHRASD